MNDLWQVFKTFLTDPAWLLPAAVSVAVQLVLTHHVKAFLPVAWPSERRDAAIWLLSCFIGVALFVPTRWAWLTLAGETFTAAQLVLSAAVALLVIAAMPWIYSKLPAEFRDAYSYRRKVERRE